MNTNLRRIERLAVALLLVLVAATGYWQLWARPELAARQDNAIQRVAEFRIKRGPITASGVRLARSDAEQRGRETLWFRRYPLGRLGAHVVGYSTAARSRTGLERSLNDALTASDRGLGSLVERSLRDLKDDPVVGDTVVTTLDVPAQRAALEALGSNCGAVVALDPRTGRVRVLASSPSFDPNLAERRFDEIEAITANCEPASPLLNRATAGLYPPGSTFKVVTAAAALDSGRFEPTSEFVDPGYCLAYGKRVNNFDTSRPFGRIDLATALRFSVNSVFCTIGQRLGAKRILAQGRLFGFYETAPLETPSEERRASGLYRDGALWLPERNSDVDAGRMAFGQERLLVTPLQMAMVAGAVGNAGVLLRPTVVEKIVSASGSARRTFERRRLGRAMKPTTARDLAQMMVSAVEGGTGTAARLPGYRVGGKTGTAETGVAGRNVTWFIAFAGREGERPSVAIAVVLQNQSSTGGATAAPIARSVMEAILQSESNR